MMTAGTRLGPYEVIDLVGRGGMGEVYRARDPRLGRDVALKVLPPDVAGNAVRKARFAREARTISQLSHPHVCALFDIGEHEDLAFLVMEFIDGESLERRLRHGPLAWGTALEWAIQIASALDAAHRQGIIHRDLKPANIMVTDSGIKLVDFGLARLLDSSDRADQTASAPPPETLTAEHTVVGTLHYMSPEQLEGRAVDARTDVFALGTTVYEMLTGRKAFDGASAASVTARILTADPPPVTVADSRHPLAPPALDHVVRRAIAKDPDARWQTIRDFMHELGWILEARSQSWRDVVSPRPMLVRGAIVAATLAVVVAGWLLLRPAPAPTPIALRGPVVLTIAAPPGTRFHPGNWEPAVSPDGRHVAFVAGPEGGVARIWVRSLEAAAARPLMGTDSGNDPFWSPDSRAIGFYVPQESQLKRVPLSGGAPTLVTALASVGTPSAFWAADDTIVFTQGPALHRVPAAGGTPAKIGEGVMPAPLPDGRLLSVVLGPNRQPRVQIHATEPSAGATLAVESNAIFAAGHLLFRQGTSLFAQPFDVRASQLGGRPLLLAADVRFNPANGRTVFHASDDVLSYRLVTPRRLVWRNRSGEPGGSIGEVGRDFNPVAAPDGSGRVAVDRFDPATNSYRVWTISDGGPARAVTDGPRERFAAWSPDGRWIAYWAAGANGAELRRARADGSGGHEVLVTHSTRLAPLDWSKDGTFILYEGGSPSDLWAIRAEGPDRAPIQLTNTPGRESTARFSPDGRWIAYTAQEQGRSHVWVQRFPGGEERHRMSENGGADPAWRADGQEIFYLASDGMLTAVAVRGAVPSFGRPAGLFTIPIDAPGVLRSYTAQPDGQRFLVSEPIDTPDVITVVLNWTALLR